MRVPDCVFFFFNDTATTEIYTLSLHDALPISVPRHRGLRRGPGSRQRRLLRSAGRSEEHTSELQSPCNLVCRLLLEKKNTITESSYFLQLFFFSIISASIALQLCTRYAYISIH